MVDAAGAAVNALARVARPVILTEFRRDSCIASTRIGIDALAYFGVSAIPVPLRVWVFNQRVLELVEQGASMDQIGELVRGVQSDALGGPWSMMIGAKVDGSDGWAGHLMIGLPCFHTLVDLSIDQASRPRKDLVFDEPLVFSLPKDEWWAAREKKHVHVGHRAGSRAVLVLDRDVPDADGFRASPNWRRRSSSSCGKEAFKRVTGEVIRLMKRELAEHEAGPQLARTRDRRR
jgi:hypothetical protein